MRYSTMKRGLSFCLLLAALLTVTACDWNPVVISLHVEDAEGHNRLDPTSDYFIGENISAIYEGQVYPVEIIGGPDTKTYMPRFFGLELRPDRMFGWYLTFGEFEGSESQDISVTLVWPDGTSDTIRCKHTVATPLAVTTHYKLNGKRTTPPITLVK